MAERKKPGRKPTTDWRLIAYDENGTEIARIKNLTEKEANKRVVDYPRATAMKDEVPSAGTICQVEGCTGKAVTMARPASLKEAIPVCRYHGCAFYAIFKIPGLRRFEGLIVKNKLVLKSLGQVVASNTLCIKYCPSYYKGECRAMLDPIDTKARRKLAKGFRGMSILCVEDKWWRK